MKKTIVCGLLAVVLVLAFTACSGSGGGGKSLNSATELKEYLDKQSANSPDNPIKVAMKVNNMMIGEIVRVINGAGKYVSLDLSGSPLTEIDGFGSCTPLVGITIPNSVTSIGSYAFMGSSGLTSITIPNSVTSIGEWAFSGTGLASVTIPNSVTSIGGDAFRDCTSLTSITADSGNPNYASEGGILYNKAKTAIVYVPRGISGNVTIPNSVTFINGFQFQNCTNLTSVTIPSSVTEIWDRAFEGCTGLTSITIPSSVTFIRDAAFWECWNLRTVTVSRRTTIGYWVFPDTARITYSD